MKIIKDIYEYITNFVDDSTAINMFSVNKTFHKDILFGRYVIRKYPLLIEFKKDKSWKIFLIRMLHYINRLENNYNIPYIPTKGYNPEEFYNKFKNYKDIHDWAAGYAAEGGHLDIINKLIQNNETKIDYNWMMVNAALGNQIELIKLMIQYGANDYDEGLAMGADKGFKNIIEMMIKYGARNYNRAIMYAAYSGHIDIVELLIKYGANDFDSAMVYASGGGHLEIVSLMIDYGATDYEEAISWASLSNHINVIEYFNSIINKIK